MINQSYVLAHRKPFNERFGMFLWPYDHSGYNAVFFKKQLDAALDLGVGLISIGSRPDNANDDVGAIDGAFDMAQNAGMAVRTTLGAGAALNGNAVDYPNHIHDMDDWNKRYVQHLAGRNLVWDASNEANNPDFWYGKSSYYDHSLIKDWLSVDKVLYDYVRQYDPGSIFLNGDLYRGSYDLQKGQWADEWDVMVQDGLMSFGDAISVHPYMEDAVTGVPHAPEEMLTYMATPTNATLPIVVTEFSYSRKTMGSDQQADWLMRAWFIMDMMQIPFVIHYGFWDEYEDDNGGASIFDHDWNALPAAQAFTYWLHALKGYYFNERLNVGSDADYVLDYVSSPTHQVVGWTASSSHQVTVNGQNYTLTNTPTLLTSYQAATQLQSLTTIWQLKTTMNQNFGLITQFVNMYLTHFKPMGFAKKSQIEAIQSISANTLGRDFRNQMIASIEQADQALELVAQAIRHVGRPIQLEPVAIKRGLILRADDFNQIIDSFSKNIKLIEQYKLG